MRQWTVGARHAIASLGIIAGSIAGFAALAAADTPPDDGQWVRPAKDLASTRYSGLDQINESNVAQLRVAFKFSTGVVRGHEAAPIVAENTMFIVGPYPNTLFALDLTKPGGPLKWTFDPKPDPSSKGVACCDLVNRGAVYADGRVFFNTLDNQTLAVDARTGKELWRVRLGDIKLGESMTMAPLVVKDKVLVGNSGGEFGVRGWLIALDAASGRIVWKAWSTGPDKDVLIGPNFKPFYPQDRGKDLGVSSWPADAWKIGGGNVWAWISYDPEQDLVIYGTGNPGPWNPEQRPGDNKWTSGVFARKADTGEAVWYYQYSPHDLHDYDGVNEHVLLDLTVAGQPRKLLVHPDRNGYVYLMDRTNGQVLSASAFVPITTSTGVDLQTGVLRYNPSKDPRGGETVRNICPASPGGKDWQPSAWSPRTGLLYIPHQNICQDTATSQVSYIAGTPYVGADIKMTPGPGGNRGLFTAWDPLTGKKAWAIPEFFPVWSGALATAGDVVFYGTMDGWFKAVHAKTGALLWKFKADSGIIGQPVSYRGPDGK
ncbi:MAG: PQQ-dependent dehydrogenase, methanol/ethanol family, partial [Ramlibacter sp.]|nr:PQQ-dependent dehydrogenase, methanol/ethanol family [Ramlibacter sp.]